MSQALLLLTAFFLVLLNGFFVAAEFALVKVRRTRLTEIAATGSWRARLSLRLVTHLDAYLSATQLGITLASIGLGWIGEPAVAHLLEPLLARLGITNPAMVSGVAFSVAFAFIAFLHIVLGELAPKSLAIRKAEAVSLWVAAPLLAFYYVFSPAIVVLNAAANALLRVVGIAPVTEGDEAHSGEELRMIVAASHAHGMVGATASRLVENALRFSELRIGEIMVPRTKMVALSAAAPVAECIALALRHGHSRYPVRGPGRDEIIGMVHVKDLLRLCAEGAKAGSAGTLAPLVRPSLFIPETASLDKAMRTMQEKKTLQAIVVDEHGAPVGLVTLEDLVERLVGDIRDEFDATLRARPGRAKDILEGDDPVAVLRELAGIEPRRDRHVHTVGGYLLRALGRVPRTGERVVVDGRTFEILAMDGRRIARVRLAARAPEQRARRERPARGPADAGPTGPG
ncbi:MAG: hemolysin family protein [Phycisphaerales bacterium]